MILILLILLPIIGGIFVFRCHDEKKRNTLVVGLVSADALLALAAALMPQQQIKLLSINSSLSLVLGTDGISKLFLVLIAAVWVLVAFFAFPYIKHEGKDERFFGFYTMTMGILMGLSTSASLVTLYMFYEMMTIITVPLVIHNGTEEAAKAGLKYLGYSVFGAGLALLGFFFLAQYSSSTEFIPGGTLLASAGENRSLLLIAYLLMFIGFGAKAGLLPLQSWLTTAHPVAPAPGSAVLSGIITKAGVLGIIRVTYYLFGVDFLKGSWVQTVLMILTLATVFVGSMLAYKEKILKKRLAYSTVSQVSYVLFGLTVMNPVAFAGALLQVLFHAAAKNTLFLSAGAIIYNTGCTRVDELKGIGKKMPVTMWCFALASLSLIGIPPMAGFVSKWYLAAGALEGGYGALGIIGTAILLVSALLTAGYLLPIVTEGFFPGSGFQTEKKEVGKLMTVPLILLSASAVLMGCFPNWITGWIGSISSLLF